MLETAILMAAFVSAGNYMVSCRCSGAAQGNQVSQPADCCPSCDTGFRSFRSFEPCLLFRKTYL